MSASLASALHEIVMAISQHRYNVSTEDELQQAVAAALQLEMIPYMQQAELAPGDRIDFIAGGGAVIGGKARALPVIGVELKTKGSLAAVTRQLFRYSMSPMVNGLLLVTTQSRHSRVPKALNGKPIGVISLRTGM